MKLSSVDLRSPAQPQVWAWRLTTSLVLMALIATGIVYEQARVVGRLKAELLQMNSTETVSTSIASIPVQKMPYDGSSREMLTLAKSNWFAPLSDLESVENPGVVLTALEITSEERRARVEVQVSDYAALLEYLRLLNAQVSAGRWNLLQAQVSAGRTTQSDNKTATSAIILGVW